MKSVKNTVTYELYHLSDILQESPYWIIKNKVFDKVKNQVDDIISGNVFKKVDIPFWEAVMRNIK